MRSKSPSPGKFWHFFFWEEAKKETYHWLLCSRFVLLSLATEVPIWHFGHRPLSLSQEKRTLLSKFRLEIWSQVRSRRSNEQEEGCQDQDAAENCGFVIFFVHMWKVGGTYEMPCESRKRRERVENPQYFQTLSHSKRRNWTEAVWGRISCSGQHRLRRCNQIQLRICGVVAKLSEQPMKNNRVNASFFQKRALSLRVRGGICLFFPLRNHRVARRHHFLHLDRTEEIHFRTEKNEDRVLHKNSLALVWRFVSTSCEKQSFCRRLFN